MLEDVFSCKTENNAKILYLFFISKWKLQNEICYFQMKFVIKIKV